MNQDLTKAGVKDINPIIKLDIELSEEEGQDVLYWECPLCYTDNDLFADTTGKVVCENCGKTFTIDRCEPDEYI